MQVDQSPCQPRSRREIADDWNGYTGLPSGIGAPPKIYDGGRARCGAKNSSKFEVSARPSLGQPSAPNFQRLLGRGVRWFASP